MRARNFIRWTIWIVFAIGTLAALFYTEENWRGARALAEAQENAKRTGQSLDFRSLIPPPIPDADNLAALPLFAQQWDPTSKDLEPVLLTKALQAEGLLSPLPSLGSWQHGELPDRSAQRQFVADAYAKLFKSGTAPASTLMQFEAIWPFVAELRNASLTRTRCRFDFDYDNRFATARSVRLLTDQIRLTQIVCFDAELALHERQPDIALADLRVILLLQSGVRRDPSIIANLVSIGMGALSQAVVADGLALSAWNDPQLAQLQQSLGQLDFLSDYRPALHGEVAAQLHDFPIFRPHFAFEPNHLHIADAEQHRVIKTYLPWPLGWADGGMAHLIRFTDADQAVIDAQARRVYPERILPLIAERNRGILGNRFILPWSFVFIEMSTGFNTLAGKFARAQAWADHSVLACALARYRLAHGSYPPHLTDLVPSFITKLPQDFMNGEPYHYRVLPDGSYLLYSVGWNQSDDGGTLVFQKGYHPSPTIDYDQGDWVWFGPK